MEPQDVLAHCQTFANLGPEALQWLAQHCTELSLRSGESLIEVGAIPEAIYVVVTGRLRASLPSGVTAGEVGRFEIVGEIGLFSGEAHGAHVQALRDSRLLRIAAPPLLEFVRTHPDALLGITRMIVQRMRANLAPRVSTPTVHSSAYAVVPAHPRADAMGFARALQRAFENAGSALLIDAATVDRDLGEGQSALPGGGVVDDSALVSYLNGCEADSASRHLLYVANPDADPWSVRCLGQVDRILLVLHAGDQPLVTPMVQEALQVAPRVPIDLVVLGSQGHDAGDIAGWCRRIGTRTHYLVRNGNNSDLGSLARQISGHGIGVVLGGGGARGFAHIGLFRALEELKIPVDLSGGSSMGAFLAALVACGLSSSEILHVTRETFVSHNYLNDYALPRVSLIRGRKFLARLRTVFGERTIETLPMPFFCISTNLTAGRAVVHDEGPLAIWVGTSMAVPGVAPPIAWHGELLADGAVINSLPTDIMQAMGRGPIIASDVSTEGALLVPGVEGPDPDALLRGSSPVSLLDILFRTATLTSESGIKSRAARADAYLRMPVDGVGMFDWKRLDEIVDRGYRFAMEVLGSQRSTLLANAPGVQV